MKQPSRLCLPLLLFALLLILAASYPSPSVSLHPLPVRAAEGENGAEQFVPGYVLVGLHPWAGARIAEQLALVHGFSVASAIQPLNLYQLLVPEGGEQAALEKLHDDAAVAWAQLDGINQAMFVPNDSYYGSLQWNLRQVGMEAAWDITRGSESVVVAVLDTGADARHPELASNLVPGYDFLNDDPVPEDDSSHGTHTAGIIVARGNNGEGIAGVAWGARVMPIKVLNARGLGPESAMIKGLIYAVDQGARVINISSGTNRPSRAMAEAVAYAHQKGALVISAAGNSGDKENAVIYPAAYPEVLAVGATDPANAVAPFSQRHPYVRLVAPGVKIPSTAWSGAGIGPYALADGTSAAAPHVAGLAALIWSLDSGLTNEQVAQLILDHAQDIHAPGRDDVSGFGLISATRTLSALRPLAPTPAPAAAPQPSGTTTPAAPGPAPQPLPTLAPLPTPAPLPSTPSDWYFAEGSSKPPFDTWLHILNPNEAPTEVQIRYLLIDGQVREQKLTVPASARSSVFVNQVIPEADFSMHVHSDTQVFVERAMFFGQDGHVAGGVSSPSPTWYLAEGSTQALFDTWILLQNANSRPVSARLTFFLSNGQRREFVQFLAPNSRESIYVNLLFQAEGFSTSIVADAPIVAERAMYFFERGRGGHSSVGVNAPAKTWYLAEGSSLPGFETWLVLHNPGDAPVQVQVRYLREQGAPVESSHTLAPRGRANIPANQSLPNSSFGATIEATAPIVVERAMYFGNERRGGHISGGAVVPSLEWYLAEGSTKPPFEEFIAILNPNRAPADLEVSLLPTSGGEPQVLLFQMRPESRLTLDVKHLAPNVDVSARIRSTRPIVVERSMYFSDRDGGTSALGASR